MGLYYCVMRYVMHVCRYQPTCHGMEHMLDHGHGNSVGRAHCIVADRTNVESAAVWHVQVLAKLGGTRPVGTYPIGRGPLLRVYLGSVNRIVLCALLASPPSMRCWAVHEWCLCLHKASHVGTSTFATVSWRHFYTGDQGQSTHTICIKGISVNHF